MRKTEHCLPRGLAFCSQIRLVQNVQVVEEAFEKSGYREGLGRMKD